ncbi:MAG: DUF368 domain-containing protein [Oleiphilus sp.]
MKFELWVLIKGMLMGAADIVPGVSGGTIAFITGIYERLLTALKMLVPSFFSLIKKRDVKLFIKETDLLFLLTLFTGILISVASLAKVISFMMLSYPIPLWSGFFGLIFASVFVVARDIQAWNLSIVMCLLVGVLIALGITQLSPASLEKNTITIFLSGVLAICAMVLPGISGSFILVILGSYAWVLSAIKEFEFTTLGLFSLGCLLGLLSIANLLSWTFQRYREATLSVLTGFMLGAMVKVWPWKEVLSYRENSKGELVPLADRAISPSSYELISGNDPQLVLAVSVAVISSLAVWFLANLVKMDKK